MNVYLFELKRSLKSALIWAGILCSMLFLLMGVVFPIYQQSKEAVEQILEGFPPEFAAAFGMSVADIFSFGGFYAFGFLYLSLLGAMMAASLGLGIFSREKRSRCTDFLLTKPCSRQGLFFRKLAAALTLLVLFNLLYIALTVLLYQRMGEGNVPLGRVLLAASALFFTQLVLFAAAVCAAVFLRRIRSVSGMTSALGFGGFLLTALHSVVGDDWLRLIAPYKFFDVSTAFLEGRFQLPYVLSAAVLTVGFMAAAFLRYCQSDVRAV